LQQENFLRMRDYKNFRKGVPAKLGRDFIKNRMELINEVNTFRRNFKEKERKVRVDLEEAYKIWKKMGQTLKERK
jgi:hypothetical protein